MFKHLILFVIVVCYNIFLLKKVNFCLTCRVVLRVTIFFLASPSLPYLIAHTKQTAHRSTGGLVPRMTIQKQSKKASEGGGGVKKPHCFRPGTGMCMIVCICVCRYNEYVVCIRECVGVYIMKVYVCVCVCVCVVCFVCSVVCVCCVWWM